MEFNYEQTSYIYIHSQGLTNMWKAFPSPLMVNEYHDIIDMEKKCFWLYRPALHLGYFIYLAIEKSLNNSKS